MLQQNQGRIIQISSLLGLVAMKYRGAYNASKFALEGYTDTLRLELRDTAIQISLVEPGPIRSEFRSNALKNSCNTSTQLPVATANSIGKHCNAYKIQILKKSILLWNQSPMKTSAACVTQ